MFGAASAAFQEIFALDSVFLVGLLVGAALLWTRWRRLGRALVTALAGAGALVALVFMPELVAAPLERGYPAVTALPEKIDGIVAVNGIHVRETALTGELHLDEAGETFVEFLRLAAAHPEARRVISVGDPGTAGPGGSAAQVVRDFLARFPGDLRGVLVEDRSQRSFDRVPNLRALVHPAPGETWLLVTPALRAERNLALFRSAGWPVVPVPVAHHRRPPAVLEWEFARNLRGTWYGLKEWIGLAAYRAAGFTR
jgi:uncharacterized SAM-binding protein YcdF (DUF218 family)